MGAESLAQGMLAPEMGAIRAVQSGLIGAAKKYLPLNMGMLASTILGDRAPITDKSLTAQELTALRAAASHAAGYGKGNIISYPDYQRRSGDMIDSEGWGAALSKSRTDPNYRLATTIGAAHLAKDRAGNTHVIDTYDFNADGPGANIVRSPSQAARAVWQPTKILDALGFLMAPDTAKDRRKVDINLGMVGPAKRGMGK